MLELIAKVTGGVVKCRFYGGGGALLWGGFPFNSPLNSSVELQTRHLSSALAPFWRLLRRAASKREFYCDSLCFIHTVCEWMWLSYCSTHCFDHCRWCTSTVQLVIYSLCVGVFFFFFFVSFLPFWLHLRRCVCSVDVVCLQMRFVSAKLFPPPSLLLM